MVRLSVLGWSVAALALIGARPALAGPIQQKLTGNVEQDFPSSNPDVRVINVNKSPSDVLSVFVYRGGDPSSSS